jgi:hypothetical protein
VLAVGFLLVATIANYFFSKLVSKIDPPKTYRDPVTGKLSIVRPRNTFNFLPVQYWTYIWGAIGVTMLMVAWVHLEGGR